MLRSNRCYVGYRLRGRCRLITESGLFCHWGAIVDRNQNVYFTNGPLISLPSEYRKALWDGQNLEEIMHHSTGIKSLGSKEGGIGIFTQNRLNRE